MRLRVQGIDTHCALEMIQGGSIGDLTQSIQEEAPFEVFVVRLRIRDSALRDTRALLRRQTQVQRIRDCGGQLTLEREDVPGRAFEARRPELALGDGLHERRGHPDRLAHTGDRTLHHAVHVKSCGTAANPSTPIKPNAPRYLLNESEQSFGHRSSNSAGRFACRLRRRKSV